ncbi:MAG: hypothetical protein LBQ42_11085 [Synergistaceae bacterium]|nr:hypothetical protein [Synergistaceae bacterium]
MSAVFLILGLCLFPYKIQRLKKDCDALAALARDSVYAPKTVEIESLKNLWKTYRNTFEDAERESKTETDAEEALGYFLVVSENMSRRFWALLPAFFVGAGILGTFVGLALGIGNFNTDTTETIQASIRQLLSGMNTAFYTSIFGMSFSLLFSFTERIGYRFLKVAAMKMTDALNDRYFLPPLEVRRRREDKFVQMLDRLFKESEKQSKSLSNFSTDLAETIGEALDKKLALTFASLNTTIAELKNNNSESVQGLVSDVVGKLTDAFAELQEKFSASSQEAVQQIGQTVALAAEALKAVPVQIGETSSHLVETMDRLQSSIGSEFEQHTQGINHSFTEGAEKIDASTEKMLAGMLEASREYTQFASTLDEMMQRFKETIESTVGLQSGLSQSAERLEEILSRSADTLESVDESLGAIEQSHNALKEVTDAVKRENDALTAQRSLLYEATQTQIGDMQQKISDLRAIHADYVTQFPTIRDGLQGVFAELSTGLNDFQNAVREQMNNSIADFSRTFADAANTLSGAVQELSEDIEEMHNINAAKNISDAKANSPASSAVPGTLR